MDFHIGCDIQDRDGDVLGKLGHVIVDPETKEVVEIVLAESGLLGRDVLVPIGLVDQMDGEAIRLEVSKDQAGKLKDFVVTNYLAPTPETYASYPWAGGALIGQGLSPIGAATGVESIAFTPIVETEEQIPEGDVDIETGTEVWATDGKVGKVRDVLVDEQTNRIRGFVIEEGFLFHKSVEVSADQIANVGADRITLKVSKDVLEPSA